MAEVKIWPRGQNETGGILLMPMKKKHPKRASGMEPGKMSDLRTGMLETNVKTGDPAEENASSLHRVRTQNRK